MSALEKSNSRKLGGQKKIVLEKLNLPRDVANAIKLLQLCTYKSASIVELIMVMLKSLSILD